MVGNDPWKDADGKIWHYATGAGATVGPVTAKDLADLAERGEISCDTALWNPSFGNQWRAASSVRELGKALEQSKRRSFESAADGMALGKVKDAFLCALSATVGALFRRFNPGYWLSLVFLFYLSSLSAISVVRIDTADFMAEGSRGMAALAAAIAQNARNMPGEMLSLPAAILVLFNCLVVAFIVSRAGLMICYKVGFRSIPFFGLWHRVSSFARGLALFRMALAILSNVFLGIGLYHAALEYGKSPSADMAALLASILSSKPVLACGAGYAALLLCSSLSYHFIEPVMARFSVPFSLAAAKALGVMLADWGTVLRFILSVALVKTFFGIFFSLCMMLCFAIIGSISGGAGAQGMLFFFFPVYWIVNLPFQFLIRVWGMSLISYKGGDNGKAA